MRTRRGLLLALLGVALAGCGEETPLRAIYEIAHDLEHRDAEGVCARLFPGALLPPRVATAVGLPPGHGHVASWDSERRRCVRDLGRHGDYAGFSFEAPIVRGVEDVAVPAQDGITAVARARVQLEHEPERTRALVEFEGVWRLVVGAAASQGKGIEESRRGPN
jgi:hypothetical protein